MKSHNHNCVVCNNQFEHKTSFQCQESVGICEPCFLREKRMKQINRYQLARGERRYKVGIVKVG